MENNSKVGNLIVVSTRLPRKLYDKLQEFKAEKAYETDAEAVRAILRDVLIPEIERDEKTEKADFKRVDVSESKKGEFTKREVIGLLNKVQMEIETFITARKGVGQDTTDLEQLHNFVSSLIEKVMKGEVEG